MTIWNKVRYSILMARAEWYKFPIIEITQGAIDYFKDEVRGNSNKSDLEIIKKINRDFYSGQQIHKDNGKLIIAYGYLHIIYDRKLNIIYGIENHNSYSYKKEGKINRDIRDKLNKLYGIKESK